MAKILKNNLGKFGTACFIFLLVFIWVFFGQSRIVSFAQEFDPTPETATSTPEMTNLTPATSTPETAISTPSVSEQSTDEFINEETDETPLVEQEELPTEQLELFQLPLLPQIFLKERKFQKEVIIDKNPLHSCVAKNFSIDLSNKDQAVVELEFTGMRSDLENLEVGSLPLGIDITFLNNGDYSWSPSKSDDGAVLKITNQPGSQKGNFSIPIIYQSGNSTTVCQINIINF
jgi:hypothetical protein